MNINKEKIGQVLGVYFAPTFVQITCGDIDGSIFSTRRYRLGDLGVEIIEETEKIIEKELNKSDICCYEWTCRWRKGNIYFLTSL